MDKIVLLALHLHILILIPLLVNNVHKITFSILKHTNVKKLFIHLWLILNNQISITMVILINLLTKPIIKWKQTNLYNIVQMINHFIQVLLDNVFHVHKIILYLISNMENVKVVQEVVILIKLNIYVLVMELFNQQ